MPEVNATEHIIKVLIADDHPVIRKGVQMCLADREEIKIVGEAVDGDETLRRARELSPDVILIDISMPGMSGLAVTEVLRKEAPDIKVLILSAHASKSYILQAIEAGAHGYVSKEAPPKDLVRAITTVYGGEPFFSEKIVRAAMNEFVAGGLKQEPFAQLTPREREVLVAIAEGHSNKEIGQALGIGVRTIETHRAHIMRRLGIHSVAGLTKYAIANGLVTLEAESKAPGGPSPQGP